MEAVAVRSVGQIHAPENLLPARGLSKAVEMWQRQQKRQARLVVIHQRVQIIGRAIEFAAEDEERRVSQRGRTERADAECTVVWAPRPAAWHRA